MGTPSVDNNRANAYEDVKSRRDESEATKVDKASEANNDGADTRSDASGGGAAAGGPRIDPYSLPLASTQSGQIQESKNSTGNSRETTGSFRPRSLQEALVAAAWGGTPHTGEAKQEAGKPVETDARAEANGKPTPADTKPAEEKPAKVESQGSELLDSLFNSAASGIRDFFGGGQPEAGQSTNTPPAGAAAPPAAGADGAEPVKPEPAKPDATANSAMNVDSHASRDPLEVKRHLLDAQLNSFQKKPDGTIVGNTFKKSADGKTLSFYSDLFDKRFGKATINQDGTLGKFSAITDKAEQAEMLAAHKANIDSIHKDGGIESHKTADTMRGTLDSINNLSKEIQGKLTPDQQKGIEGIKKELDSIKNADRSVTDVAKTITDLNGKLNALIDANKDVKDALLKGRADSLKDVAKGVNLDGSFSDVNKKLDQAVDKHRNEEQNKVTDIQKEQFKKDMTQLQGLIKSDKFKTGEAADLKRAVETLAKFSNPDGSIKDGTAKYAVEEAKHLLAEIEKLKDGNANPPAAPGPDGVGGGQPGKAGASFPPSADSLNDAGFSAPDKDKVNKLKDGELAKVKSLIDLLRDQDLIRIGDRLFAKSSDAAGTSKSKDSRDPFSMVVEFKKGDPVDFQGDKFVVKNDNGHYSLVGQAQAAEKLGSNDQNAKIMPSLYSLKQEGSEPLVFQQSLFGGERFTRSKPDASGLYKVQTGGIAYESGRVIEPPKDYYYKYNTSTSKLELQTNTK